MSSRQGKKYKTAREKVDINKYYEIVEALKLLEEISFSRFDESIDLAVR